MISNIFVNEIFYRYRREEDYVLNNVSLDIQNDTIVAVLGNNGSGKTTLLLTLLKRLIPTAGTIDFVNKDDRDEHPIRIGYLPQIEKIPFGFTIEEYVLLGRFPHIGVFHVPTEEDLSITQKVLGELEIEGMQRRKIYDLSGGELQKVRIARTLVQEPDIFLLDEPANHLDLRNRQELLSMIKKMKKDRKIIIFTTHDPNDALAIAEKVLLMHKGKAIEFGETKAVMQKELLQKTFDIPIQIKQIEEKIIILTGD